MTESQLKKYKLTITIADCSPLEYGEPVEHRTAIMHLTEEQNKMIADTKDKCIDGMPRSLCILEERNND